MMKDIPCWALKNVNSRLLDANKIVSIKKFSFGNCHVNAHSNTQIANATIEYILTTKKCDEFLFDS